MGDKQYCAIIDDGCSFIYLSVIAQDKQDAENKIIEKIYNVFSELNFDKIKNLSNNDKIYSIIKYEMYAYGYSLSDPFNISLLFNTTEDNIYLVVVSNSKDIDIIIGIDDNKKKAIKIIIETIISDFISEDELSSNMESNFDIIYNYIAEREILMSTVFTVNEFKEMLKNK